MSARVVGMAVGAVLQNREAIANASAPVRNVAVSIVSVIFSTIWKSLAIGVAVMLIWISTHAFTSIFMMNGAGHPFIFLGLGVFLFFVVPSVVFAREVYRASNIVRQKNAEQRVKAQEEKEQTEAKYAEAVAAWETHQQMEAANNAPQLRNPATQPMSQTH